MDRQEAQELLNNYLNGKCTDEEKLRLEQWYNQKTGGIDPMPPVEDWVEIEREILERLPVGAPKRIRTYPYVAFASLIALMLVVGLFFVDLGKGAEEQVPHDVLPGGNKAVLTLADGRTIDLSSAQEEVIMGANAITYSDGSALEIDGFKGDKGELKAFLNGYNTLATPKGGQYRLVLPDGTKVWLNAASTLRYPVDYNDGNRAVELEGEAYFEVTKRKSGSKSSPFSVKTAGQGVTVLGTEFNVSAYPTDELVKTTLVTGKVKINTLKERQELYLRPGQESVLSPSGIDIHQADIQAATSWKNGDFVFADDGIESVMRQLSRWYDVEIEYKGPIPLESFGGKVSRAKNLSQVLKILEATGGVKFQIEDKKIIVTP